MTRGERVCAFIERYCIVPEGALRGHRIVLLPFERRFILAVYDNPHGTTLAILSMARKNGKTALIACILLAHVAGPEAIENSQIVSGAQSRDQAALVFKLAVKMIRYSTQLQRMTRIVPTTKTIIGLARNVEYRALSKEGKTAHGLSPALAILDELGQVRGPKDDFVDAITTSQGAYEAPLLLVISTQAPNDADLLSVWIDDALGRRAAGQDEDEEVAPDPHAVCHLYEAHRDCAVLDEQAWRDANPALGHFLPLAKFAEEARTADRMPSKEPGFRNLKLNQRVETVAPLIPKSVWLANSFEPDVSAFETEEVYAGLDLSARTDLCAYVRIAEKDVDGLPRVHVSATFWTPEEGLAERAKRDRQPYAQWVAEGWIRTTKGGSIDYDEVAADIREINDGTNIVACAFDRWRIDVLQKAFERIDYDELNLVPWGQGSRDMSPAIDEIEALLLNDSLSHGNNPVLTMCAANAVAKMDETGGRKLDKLKATGRMDGIQALTMAAGLRARFRADGLDLTDLLSNPVIS